MRIIIASDTHLSPLTPEAHRNWDSIVRYVCETKPDLVLHLGDLTLDGSRAPEELAPAHAALARLPVPWKVIPGNHDVGDIPGSGVPADMVMSPACRERWRTLFGPHDWRMSHSGWTFLAIDAQLLGSGYEEEELQWQWLERQLDELRATPDQLAVLTHKPVTASEHELQRSPSFMYAPAAARQRLRELFRPRPPELVLSGHIHQQRELLLDGSRHLWAPTSWALLPDKIQPTVGVKQTGVLDLTLGEDGSVRWELVTPEGLAQYTLFRDLPNPYGKAELKLPPSSDQA